jgi:hypothetical protein
VRQEKKEKEKKKKVRKRSDTSRKPAKGRDAGSGVGRLEAGGDV